MTNQVTRPRSSVELLRAAKQLTDHSRAASTLRTYSELWDTFCEFCARYHSTPLPANFATLLAYMTYLVQERGCTVTTVRSNLAALRYYHAQARLPDPTNDHTVAELLRSLSLHYGAPPQSKAPITLAELKAVLDVQPADLRGARNRALLLTQFACDLRRSEVVALTLRDVDFRPDRLVVTLRQSKTDQTHQGFTIHVPRLANPRLCPARVLQTWLTAGEIRTGAIFRKVDRWGHVGAAALDAQSVALIIKQAAAGIGKDPTLYSGHSPRRGFITQAARNGATSLTIRMTSRHQSEKLVAHYVEAESAEQMKLIRQTLGEAE